MQHLHGAFMYKTQGQWGHQETQLHKCCAYYMHIYIYINKLGLLINKSILLRNPVRASFQELLVGAAIPGAHGGQGRQVPGGK